MLFVYQVLITMTAFLVWFFVIVPFVSYYISKHDYPNEDFAYTDILKSVFKMHCELLLILLSLLVIVSLASGTGFLIDMIWDFWVNWFHLGITIV